MEAEKPRPAAQRHRDSPSSRCILVRVGRLEPVCLAAVLALACARRQGVWQVTVPPCPPVRPASAGGWGVGGAGQCGASGTAGSSPGRGKAPRCDGDDGHGGGVLIIPTLQPIFLGNPG